MDRKALVEARARFEAFLKPLLATVGRLERRRHGAFYVQGLLLEGKRKTAAGMAQQYGGNEQALQQFVSQSPWDWEPLRRQLAEQMMPHLDSKAAWLLDDTGFPKEGKHSVGVARQYTGTLGKIGNCQIGVSLNYATEEGCFPLDFQLYLPESWIQDPLRAERAGIPVDTPFRSKWQLGLEMIDQVRSWATIPVLVIVADAGYGVATEFRLQLRQRGLPYVVGVQRDLGVWTSPVEVIPVVPSRTTAQPGRPRKVQPLPLPSSALEVSLALPESAWQTVTWREGSKGPMTSRFAALRVQPSHGHDRGQVIEFMQWLLVEWPSGMPEPFKYWLSSLPEESALEELVYWAKIRWWIEKNYRQLKDDLGLDHFEGRSFTGWHHHMTLTMIAFDFLLLEELRQKKNYWVWVDPAQDQAGTPSYLPAEPRLLPHLWEADWVG